LNPKFLSDVAYLSVGALSTCDTLQTEAAQDDTQAHYSTGLIM
jgi:hypothetical protein